MGVRRSQFRATLLCLDACERTPTQSRQLTPSTARTRCNLCRPFKVHKPMGSDIVQKIV